MRRFKNLVVFLLIAVLSISLVACNKDESNQLDNENENISNSTSEFPLTITDFVGREVTIEEEPERIVSLAPSVTELIFAVGAGDKVVGVTDYDTYPEEVADITKVGGFNGTNIEMVTAQEPDLIFASTLSGQEEVEALENLGIPVLVVEAKSIDQIYESISIISKINNAEEKGNEIIDEMQNKIEEISSKVKDEEKVNVFYLVDASGNWTAGKGTFIDEIINLAGGNNIASETEGWVQYSLEEIVNKNPDIIITAPHAGNVEEIKTMEGYKDTNAVKNNNIFTVSNDDIISRASNRIVLGLEEIAKFLHPEVFE